MHQRSKQPTMLEVNTLDQDFYNAAQIFPMTKYFNRSNVHLNYKEGGVFTACIDAQLKLIKERKPEFIVCPLFDTAQSRQFNQTVFKNYRVIAKSDSTANQPMLLGWDLLIRK